MSKEWGKDEKGVSKNARMSGVKSKVKKWAMSGVKIKKKREKQKTKFNKAQANNKKVNILCEEKNCSCK